MLTSGRTCTTFDSVERLRHPHRASGAAPPTSRFPTTVRSLPSTAPAPPALERREAAGPLRGSPRSMMSTCVSIMPATPAAAAGLDLSWDGLVAFRDPSPGAAARVAAAAAPAPAFNGRCGIDGCKRTFDKPRYLIAHQEGPSHLAIPYYCPLTAEHCPRAPCPRAQGGSGARIVGRNALMRSLACSIMQATPVRLRVWTCPGMALWRSSPRARELQPGSQRLQRLLQHSTVAAASMAANVHSVLAGS